MDVEGFAESMQEAIVVPEQMLDTQAARDELRRNVEVTLEFLAEHQTCGTFFVLGRIAEDMPELVRCIADAGHEIGSHSQRHLRLFNLAAEDAREAIARSKKSLEDAAGVRVRGFRAPDFSITAQSWYLMDVIRDAGYEYDSSVYPIRGHDVYGIPDASRWPYRLSNGLAEFPLSTLCVAGRRLPVLGGGYFRLYPLWLTRWALRSIEKARQPAMCYIHPYEFGPICPQVSGISPARRFRHYVNRTKTLARFAALFGRFRFGRADTVLRAAGLLG
jgi:polysaccharide deacetylase family protein (PEP-CTERM system associated)